MTTIVFQLLNRVIRTIVAEMQRARSRQFSRQSSE
jgi:hypothetical protein